MVTQRCFVLILAILSYAECAKILGIFHMPGRSHYLAGSTMMKILAEHGHEVTVVSPFAEKKPPKNYKEVMMTGVWDKMQKQNMNFFDMTQNAVTAPIIFNFMSAAMVEELFNSTNFQNLMNSDQKFDLVIMEQFSGDAIKYVAHHFKAPLIVYTALETNDWINPYQGNPDNPSYTPVMLLPYGNEMTFMQRTLNTLVYVYNQIFRTLIYIPYQNRLLHRYYPNAPDLRDIIGDVSLVFVNVDPSTHEPLPRVPSIINVGGFHVTKPKPLPKDIQNTLDNAKHGVVYFSLGSNVKSKDMPVEKRDMILRVFGKLKQTVIWKYEDESLPGKPDNVIIKNWLPQNDMFAHKNIKLFITHGGIFSTMEALYHELPVLAIPIFGDQELNAKRATKNGYARWLDFKTMTEEDLEASIRDLLSDPKYAESAKARSSIMRDKIVPPQEAIKFWVDYVIRHKGAEHLKVASLKLCWHQYVLLDVIAFIVVVSAAIIYITALIIKSVIRSIKCNKQTKVKKN